MWLEVSPKTAGFQLDTDSIRIKKLVYMYVQKTTYTYQ